MSSSHLFGRKSSASISYRVIRLCMAYTELATVESFGIDIGAVRSGCSSGGSTSSLVGSTGVYKTTSFRMNSNIVWHGTQEKYQVFDTLGGRSISEFGMEAFAHCETIKEFVNDDEKLYLQSSTVDIHDKESYIIFKMSSDKGLIFD